MSTPAIERLLDRTPHAPDGFVYLNQPQSPIFFDMLGGRLRVFVGRDFQSNRERLQEYAVSIDQEAFAIDYWTAMQEVSFNMRRGAVVSAAFFEPDEALRARVQSDLSRRGRERGFSLNRLTAPFTNFLSSSRESNIGEDLPFTGYATLELWRVTTDSGNLTAMYISTMGFFPELTGGGVLGPMSFRLVYNMFQPHIIVARVQNGAPVSALAKAEITEGPVYGVDEEPDSLMRSLTGFFEERTFHPPGSIDLDTLIARAVYAEGANKRYVYNRTRGGIASEATDKLLARGVNPENGDGAYILVWGKGKEAQWRGRQRLFVVPAIDVSKTEIN